MHWIKNSTLLHLLLLILAVTIGYGSYRMAGQAFTIYRESVANQKKIAELTQRKQELETYLRNLQAPAAAEREAKERLNLKLPGEQVVVVLTDTASSTQAQLEHTGSAWRVRLTAWRDSLLRFLHL